MEEPFIRIVGLQARCRVVAGCDEINLSLMSSAEIMIKSREKRIIWQPTPDQVPEADRRFGNLRKQGRACEGCF
jgi:hypothetical protein